MDLPGWLVAIEAIEHHPDARIEAEAATGNAVRGQHAGQRRRIEALGMHYDMAIPVNQRAIASDAGTFGAEGRADQLFAALDAHSWPTRPHRDHERASLRLIRDPAQRVFGALVHKSTTSATLEGSVTRERLAGKLFFSCHGQ